MNTTSSQRFSKREKKINKQLRFLIEGEEPRESKWSSWYNLDDPDNPLEYPKEFRIIQVKEEITLKQFKKHFPKEYEKFKETNET